MTFDSDTFLRSVNLRDLRARVVTEQIYRGKANTARIDFETARDQLKEAKGLVSAREANLRRSTDPEAERPGVYIARDEVRRLKAVLEVRKRERDEAHYTHATASASVAAIAARVLEDIDKLTLKTP